MSTSVSDLEKRLAALPDADPESTWCIMFSLEHRGLVDEVVELLERHPEATTDDVLAFEEVYCGDVEVYNEDGARVPVAASRLHLTSGMRSILTDVKGKTLKSYQYEPTGGAGDVADCNVRLNLGQHAVDLNCYGFSFDLCETVAELGALHCERMNLLDDFRAWSDGPVRTRLVGERITGVELVTESVEFDGEDPIDIDMAVAVHTAHATYTFARESWESTNIRVAVSDEPSFSPSITESNERWLRTHPELGGAKVTRSIEKLA